MKCSSRVNRPTTESATGHPETSDSLVPTGGANHLRTTFVRIMYVISSYSVPICAVHELDSTHLRTV